MDRGEQEAWILGFRLVFGIGTGQEQDSWLQLGHGPRQDPAMQLGSQTTTWRLRSAWTHGHPTWPSPFSGSTGPASHHYGPRWQYRPLTLKWLPAAALSIDMNLDGFRLQHRPWTFLWPLVVAGAPGFTQTQTWPSGPDIRSCCLITTIEK